MPKFPPPPGFGGLGGRNGGGEWRKDNPEKWSKAQRIVLTMQPEYRIAVALAIKQEAQFLRTKIVQNLTSGGQQAGAPFAPLAPNTVVSRRYKRRPEGKVLLDTADLRNSITVHTEGDTAFVGVPRSARGRDGRPLANIARVHENGQTIAIPVTRAMLRFLMAMFRTGGAQRQTSKPGGLRVGGVLIVKIPARPFIMPVVQKHYLGAAAPEAKRRFLSRVGRLMRNQLGSVPGGGKV